MIAVLVFLQVYSVSPVVGYPSYITQHLQTEVCASVFISSDDFLKGMKVNWFILDGLKSILYFYIVRYNIASLL